jgi:hypothetical protein
MLTKILFTAAVIATVIMLVRFRRRRGLVSTAAPPPRVQTGATRRLFRWLAVAVVALLIAGTAFYLYLEWRAAHEVVEVRVIDASSGRVSAYQAYRGDLDARSFVTVDGRRVHLAATERMETSLSAPH